ncbi:Glutamine synthetase [Acidilobus saccharovorans 345-15]|uniref:Glutamate--ammonia ligase n=1 Tax=Acidilobus saccharovorans (strain DSM 16705 / JCM 18335 / VKM B-2471 / 345-15) TaxID=666510 RepID=D9PZP4_ACIS3|nr:type I glutamate--ammonia ligase [Acidilobus saccharovorans]ADL18532.1 Glutamine synthetase [Acidilobus saccharovorans 345-15]
MGEAEAGKDPDFLEVQYIDLPGIVRSVTIPYESYLKKSDGFIAAFDGSSVEGFEPINRSDLLLAADKSTFSRIPWRPERARVLGKIYEPSGQRYRKDPRYVAEATIKYLADSGYGPLAGAEVEFFLFKSLKIDVLNPLRGVGYSVVSQEQPWDTEAPHSVVKRAYHLPEPMDTLEPIREKMLKYFRAFGYDFNATHHEVAVSQSEVSVKAGDPLFVADEIVTFKQVARQVARENGMVAVFLPKPLYGDNGSGLHFHLSLWDSKGNNLFADDSDGLSQTARYFIGGILEHGRSLAAFVAPTVNSYRRLVPGYEAPVYLVWGYSNRSAAVRVPATGGNKGLTRVEFRSPDPLCNPYLALAATFLAGYDGIVRKIDPGDPVSDNVYEMEGRSLKTLPKSLDEALDALESDYQYLLPVMSKELVESYIEVKRRESDAIRMYPSPVELYMYMSY